MRQKKFSQAIVFGIFLICIGLIFLLDYLGVAFDGAVQYWYIVLLMFIACLALSIALIFKANIYYVIAFSAGGIALSLALMLQVKDVTFVHTWAIIPMFGAVGALVAYAASRKSFGYLKSSTITLCVSIICFIGAMFKEKTITFAALLIAFGVGCIMTAIIKLNKKPKKSTDAVIYVSPTIDKNKDENLIEITKKEE